MAVKNTKITKNIKSTKSSKSVKETKSSKVSSKAVSTGSKKNIVSTSKKPQDVISKESPNASKKKANSIMFVVVAVVLIAVIAVAVIMLSGKSKKNTIYSVNTIEELTDTLNVKVNEPKNAEEVTYSIENDEIARVEYKKEVSDGSIMNFVLKSSSATEENITGLKNSWGTKILMTVLCEDESDIEVESFVATDDPRIMKSEWYDNDLYYSMTTDNLVTREDFLQEVNRVIIDNHIEFD